jgi:hypothetical protein
MKVDLSIYSALIEGSTLKFALGDDSSDYIDLITAKGASSGVTLTTGTIVDSDGATTTALSTNEMWLYSTKPTLSLNAATPVTAAEGTSEEVLRFDVNNANTDPLNADLNINAIRFTILTNASSSAWDKTYNLYKSTDSVTSLGSGTSYANATSTGTEGWVTIYPSSGNVIGSGQTTTYVLKADTSAMDEVSTKAEYIIVSIEDNDFFWDDGYAANANKNVTVLPVTGNKLNF